MNQKTPSCFTHLPKSWEEQLSFLKLKYGLGDLEDNQATLRERSYFLTDANFLPSPQQFISLFMRAKKEKQLKSRLVIISKDDLTLALSSEEACEIRILSSLTENEKAVLTKGALAGIILQHSLQGENWLHEVAAFQLPLIGVKTPELMELAGHAPLYVDAEDETDVMNALVKIEGSLTLRTHIESLQKDTNNP